MKINTEFTIKSIINTYENIDFTKVSSEEIQKEELKLGSLPNELKELYLKLGYGSIENGFFTIHFLIEPEDIYDEISAKELSGKIIVGDDGCGDCYAYDYKNNWKFGYIDCNCEFNELEGLYGNFIDYLYQLTLRE